MWGNFASLKDLADKARAVAENIDQQLNESVGLETPVRASQTATASLTEGLDDGWGDDDDLNADDEDDFGDNDAAEPATTSEVNKGETEETIKEPPETDVNVDRTRNALESGLPESNASSESGIENGGLGDKSHIDETALPQTEEIPEPAQKDEESATPLNAVEDEPCPQNDAASGEVDEPVTSDITAKPQSPMEDLGVPRAIEHEQRTMEADRDLKSEQTLEQGLSEEEIIANAGMQGPNGESVQSDADEVVTQKAVASDMTATISRTEFEPTTQPASLDAALVAHAHTEVHEQLLLLQHQLLETQTALQQREEQLMGKTMQLTEMESMHEREKEDLRQKIRDTKDEAKKRIQLAKERVEAAEAQLQSFRALQGSSEDDAGKQASIIAELRAEGESLARKQADMEMAVRSAKGEARELKQELENEVAAKESALSKIETLEKELKETKENLAAARRGESMADKFEEQLRKLKEEDERKGSLILSLEQQLKELKAEARGLVTELEAARKGAEAETQQTLKRLQKEHGDAVAELDAKLQKVERDAGVREDALRREVDEVRRRWQDAVRRADALSMDMQSSTAPLLRQLESAERQGRARAAAAAEVETQLRAELEDAIVAREQLAKERNDVKSKLSVLERSAKDNDQELKTAKQALDEKATKVRKLEDQVAALEADMAQKQEQWREVERLANEGVARVRSEMTQTVMDGEERHRAQLDALQRELGQEREKRRQLEQQVAGLLENAAVLIPTPDREAILAPKDAKPKKLKQSEGQAEILAGALSGWSGSAEDDSADEGSDGDDDAPAGEHGNGATSLGSLAALEGMQSRLRALRAELEGLRTSLAESERARERLVVDLRDSRTAKERLPLFEARCQELTEENRRLEMEVAVLTEEMEEMRHMYRSQLEAYIVSSTPAAASSPTLSAGPLDDSPAAVPEARRDDIAPSQPVDVAPEGSDDW